MPNYYSPHFTVDTPTALVGTSADSPRIKVTPGLRHGGVKHTHALIDISGTLLATTQVLRMFTMKSSDRILEMYLTNTHTGTLTFDVGIYLAGPTHDGAVEDANLFATITDGTAATRTALFADILSDLDRGKAIWELNGDTVDPIVDYDVCLTAVTVTTVTEGSSLLEVEYKAGGE